MAITYHQDHEGRGRDCWDRLRLLAPLVPEGSRVSILDVGSNMGFFSCELATDPHRLILSMESHEDDAQYHISKLRTGRVDNNIVFPVTVEPRLVHGIRDGLVLFDYILLLSVVHYFWYPFEAWSRMILDFVQSSRYTIFELLSTEESYHDEQVERFSAWYRSFPERPYESLLRAVLDQDPEGDYSVELLGKVRWRRDDPREHRPLLLVTNRQARGDGRVTWRELYDSDTIRRVTDAVFESEVENMLSPAISGDIRWFLLLLLGSSPDTRWLLSRARGVR